MCIYKLCRKGLGPHYRVCAYTYIHSGWGGVCGIYIYIYIYISLPACCAPTSTYKVAFHKLGATTLVMFEIEPSSLHGVASPHMFHKADTLHGIIKGGD